MYTTGTPYGTVCVCIACVGATLVRTIRTCTYTCMVFGILSARAGTITRYVLLSTYVPGIRLVRSDIRAVCHCSCCSDAFVPLHEVGRHPATRCGYSNISRVLAALSVPSIYYIYYILPGITYGVRASTPTGFCFALYCFFPHKPVDCCHDIVGSLFLGPFRMILRELCM